MEGRCGSNRAAQSVVCSQVRNLCQSVNQSTTPSRKLCYHNKEKTKPELSSVLSDVIASLMAHILFLVLQKYIQNIEEVEFKIL